MAQQVFKQKSVNFKVVQLDNVQNGRTMAANVYHISRMDQLPIIYVAGQLIGGLKELQDADREGRIGSMLFSKEKQSALQHGDDRTPNSRVATEPDSQYERGMKSAFHQQRQSDLRQGGKSQLEVRSIHNTNGVIPKKPTQDPYSNYNIQRAQSQIDIAQQNIYSQDSPQKTFDQQKNPYQNQNKQSPQKSTIQLGNQRNGSNIIHGYQSPAKPSYHPTGLAAIGQQSSQKQSGYGGIPGTDGLTQEDIRRHFAMARRSMWEPIDINAHLARAQGMKRIMESC